MRAVDVVVFGALNMDLVARVPRLPRPGETLDTSDVALYPGGKGANTAVAAARLGASVALVGRVGADEFGHQLQGALARDGVDTRFVVSTADAPTGIAMIFLDFQGQNMIVTSLGANARMSAADVANARSLMKESQWVVLQMGLGRSIAEAVIRTAAETGCHVILNQAPAIPVDPQVLGLVSVLVVNEVEAEILTGHSTEHLQGVLAAARALKAQGARASVVTLGARGALYSAPDGAEGHVPAPTVQAVDTTAAGDTFTAALAVALNQNPDLASAVTWAQYVAALSTTRHGAYPSLPRRTEVDAFVAAVGDRPFAIWNPEGGEARG